MTTWNDKPNDYEHAIAEIERLRAAIMTTQCPRPANSVPPEQDWTVSQCVASGDCGCDLGAVLARQQKKGR